jgi:hypothetical protein
MTTMYGLSRWNPFQILCFIGPYLLIFYLMTLPSYIGYIAMLMFPGWVTAYTPSALLTTLFVHERWGIKRLWDKSPLGYYDEEWYWRFFIAVEVVVLVAGYLSVINHALMFLDELQTLVTLATSGNILGLMMGYLTTYNWD